MFRKHINNKFNTNYCLKFKLILKYNRNFISEEKIISVYIKQLNIKAENIVLTCKKNIYTSMFKNQKFSSDNQIIAINSFKYLLYPSLVKGNDLLPIISGFPNINPLCMSSVKRYSMISFLIRDS